MKLIAAIVLGASSSAAFSQINYTNYFQFESLNAEAYIAAQSDVQNAGSSGPGFYVNSITASATSQVGPSIFVTSTSTTSISADVEASFISISGTFAQTPGVFMNTGGTRGRVTCDVSFELTSSYLYNFSGNFAPNPFPGPPNDPVHRDVWITGPGGFSVAPGPFAFLGSIGPGVYTLHVDIDSRSPNWPTPGFNVLFEIPTIPTPSAAALALGSLGWLARRRR